MTRIEAMNPVKTRADLRALIDRSIHCHKRAEARLFGWDRRLSACALAGAVVLSVCVVADAWLWLIVAAAVFAAAAPLAALGLGASSKARTHRRMARRLVALAREIDGWGAATDLVVDEWWTRYTLMEEWRI